MSSLPGVSCDFHHRGTQQPILQLVATLQLLEHLMILGLGGIYHLDRLMHMGIKGLTLGRNGRTPSFTSASCNCL